MENDIKTNVIDLSEYKASIAEEAVENENLSEEVTEVDGDPVPTVRKGFELYKKLKDVECRDAVIGAFLDENIDTILGEVFSLQNIDELYDIAVKDNAERLEKAMSRFKIVR